MFNDLPDMFLLVCSMVTNILFLQMKLNHINISWVRRGGKGRKEEREEMRRRKEGKKEGGEKEK